MRLSIPIVIASCLLVISLTWWIGTRDKDFMMPPTEAKLAEIRAGVEQSMPATDQPRDSVSAPSRKLITSLGYNPDRKHPMPIISKRDLESRPKLDDYSKDSNKGAGYLAELAKLLEMNHEYERASLAYERVLDSSNADEELAKQAQDSILKLRKKTPAWNSNPNNSITITLHVGTGANTAALIEPELIKTCAEIKSVSGGILELKLNLIAGENNNSNGSAPVALWITGVKEDSNSTEIQSFSVNSVENVKLDAASTIYQLTRGHLTRHSKSLTPPRALSESPTMAEIRSQMTRLHWQSFGKSLNSPM